MDSDDGEGLVERSEDRTGGPSPQLKASLPSFLTWHWLQPLIRIGNKNPLTAEDLYDLIPKETTIQCQMRWTRAVEDERQMQTRKGKINGKPHLPVWRLLYRCIGDEFMLSSLFYPFWLACLILQVYCVKSLVLIVQRSKSEDLQRWWAAIIVVAMVVTSVIQSLSVHISFTIGQRIGMRARSTIAMTVFDKLQAMRLVSLVSTNTGVMLNLVANDTQKVVDAATSLHFVWFGLVVVVVVGAFVIYEAGISGIPGVVIIMLTQPLQVQIAQVIGNIRRKAIVYTDSRVRSVNEVLTGVRVVKCNGWTAAFLKRISDLRAIEMRWIRKASFLRASTSTLRDGVIPLASLTTFGTYTALHGTASLGPARSFTILALFSVLVRLFAVAPTGIQYASETIVAIQRLQKLLDLPNGNGFICQTPTDEISATKTNDAVVVVDGDFSWNIEDEEVRKGVILPKGSKEDDIITLKNINLEVKRGELVAIVGPVGSGKSSLLLALLGEMECLAGSFKTDRPVAYAPQQPWISNSTIRSNILFGSEYDEPWYNATVTACALDHDIAHFPAGHYTEIGERGINLSGGQKARVNLARACYSRSSLVLLDDPLAAVDVPTARFLMDHVLAGILKNRTVILVTHNKTSLSFCDRVLLMDHGRLQELPKEVLLAGEVAAVLFDDPETSYANGDIMQEADMIEEVEDVGDNELEHRKVGGICEDGDLGHENGEMLQGKVGVIPVVESQRQGQGQTQNCKEGSVDAKKNASTEGAEGKLTVAEDRVEGVVTWATYIQYVKDGGGLTFFTLVMVIFLSGQAVRVMVDYWLSVWVDGKYHLSSEVYVITYAAFVLGAIVVTLGRALLFTEAAMVSAKEMHGRMTERVLRSPQLFFDQNPVGRILNRFSKDQAFVDELLPSTAQACLEMEVGVLGCMALIAVLVPWFLACIPPFVIALFYFQKRYVVVSRELKRLDGISRSPMYAHLSQTMQGVTSIRAFGAEKRMREQFMAIVDANHRAYVLFVHVARWLGVRLDFVATICVAVAAILVVLLRHTLSPGLAGVVLVQSLQLTGLLQYGVRLQAETENYFTSVERIQAYAKLPTEADPDTSPGVITKEWPENGEIEFVHYTMAYREDLPPVLNDLSFKVNAREKVGILGRTGAGKSSLVAAMFRLVENNACSGRILFDGVDIARVGLDDLRQRLSIIPQDPVLFRGTVRLNLDPFEEHTDVEINEATAKAHLSKKIGCLDNGIDSLIAENGENFSVGQRQLLCLARSLLRRSQILVMDEATAAVDGDTDKLIQTAMRSVFSGCTVLTIAHRIDTIIDCNRVLVLAHGGRVTEFDTPVNLLRQAELLSTLQPPEDRRQGTRDGNYGFADTVAQSGGVIAKQLREAAEAAERRRQDNVN